MKARYALAALAAATISTFAFAQMGPGMGGGPGMGRGPGPGLAGGDCPMQQGQGMGGGMMGRHGGMGGGMHGGMGGGMHGGMHGGKGGGMGGGMMGMGLPPGALATLGLSSEQQARITEIQRDAQRKRDGLRVTMRETRWKAQDAQKGGFSEDAARRQFDAMAAIRKEMFEAGLATRKQVEAVLTPEQREKLKQARPGPGPRPA